MPIQNIHDHHSEADTKNKRDYPIPRTVKQQESAFQYLRSSSFIIFSIESFFQETFFSFCELLIVGPKEFLKNRSMSSRWADTTDDEEDYSAPPPSNDEKAVQPQEVSC